MFKHKVDPEVQTQIDALRRGLIDVAKILKEYEEANTKAVRGIGETLKVIAQAIEKLSEERAPGAGGAAREDRWKQ